MRPHEGRGPVARDGHDIAEIVRLYPIRRCEFSRVRRRGRPPTLWFFVNVCRAFIQGRTVIVLIRPHEDRGPVARDGHGIAEKVILHPFRCREFSPFGPCSVHLFVNVCRTFISGCAVIHPERPHEDCGPVARDGHGIAESVPLYPIRRREFSRVRRCGRPPTPWFFVNVCRAFKRGHPGRPHEGRGPVARDGHGIAELVPLYPIRRREFSPFGPCSVHLFVNVCRTFIRGRTVIHQVRPHEGRGPVARDGHGIAEKVRVCLIRCYYFTLS